MTAGPPRELVERSRLLGEDQSLVVHGGGNTSAKGDLVDHLGRRRKVLWVKGSGSNLATAADDDFPVLYLDELRPLAGIDALSDEEMTDYVLRALVVPGARRPSIETLLHAFLPYAHVDHVHADAICALTNHKDGRSVTREALGERFAYVDWIRPGHELSKMVGELGSYDGVVLAHHGLVTWADDSAACYEQTLAAVAAAREFVAAAATRGRAVATRGSATARGLSDHEVRALLVRLRGRVAGSGGARVLVPDTRMREIADRPDIGKLVGAGVSSADHMFWMKPWACALPGADPSAAEAAVDAYIDRYQGYFARNRRFLPDGYDMHDPAPRAFLAPGLGAITTGRDARDARGCGDVLLHTLTVAAAVADAFGAVEPVSERATFEFDYWPMELYKLRLRPAPSAFAGRVFVVTGAASGIGRGTARHLAGLGANLVLADLDDAGLDRVCAEIERDGGPEPVVVPGDQADEDVVAETVRACVRRFGGLDGAVLNAGIAVAGTLEELGLDRWQRALAVNLTSAFLLTRESLKVMREQGGGSLVYVASKNAFGPGAGFGAYSASKAAMVQLMRVAALEGGAAGIRANAVNPDAVFGDSRLWSPELRAQRAAAHGISEDRLEDFYAGRNLLSRRVTTADVARSVAFLLSDESSRTTGSVLPVDGGVASAFPR